MDRPMTYRELRDALSELSDEQLDCSITICNEEDDECYPLIELGTAGDCLGKSVKERTPLLIF